ncbi:MAG: MMPL family transporter, partial [Acidimicrobiales bacterium]
MFARLGSWCFRKRKTVVLLWVAGVVVVGALSGVIGGQFGQDFEPPGFESTRGQEILLEDFDDQLGSGTPGTIVFRAEQGVRDPEVQAAMEQLFTVVTAIAADPEVDLDGPEFAHLSDDGRRALADADLSTWAGITLASPYDDAGARQISSTGASGDKIAFADLEIPGDDWEAAGVIGRTLEKLLPTVDGLQVELGGAALGEFEEPSTEALGLAFAVVILVVAFGSVLAMGLPIGVALAGILAGSVIVTILSNLLTMPDFAPFLGIMIGLGVGIDYALFIVTRYRENLHHGHTSEEAVAVAIDTAGRA